MPNQVSTYFGDTITYMCLHDDNGAFGLIVDHAVVLVALLAGVLLGIVGAIPPAVRCLRLPVAEALKST